MTPGHRPGPPSPGPVRAGVGKTTVGWEVSARLRAATVAHCVIEGDFMGQAHPAPEGDPGRERLTGRERGSELESSARKARILEERMPPDAVRVATDGRSVVDIAREVVGATGWL
ncbi:hypothetical protein ACFRJ1_01995 [Streptomyces sp. NPDC056773]|uniref:hypothetical protein n=1 Tax=unclassified Streptomyces TaxID=2593676 RepID=UPI003694F8DD